MEAVHKFLKSGELGENRTAPAPGDPRV